LSLEARQTTDGMLDEFIINPDILITDAEDPAEFEEWVHMM
jgi:hypothetical protein